MTTTDPFDPATCTVTEVLAYVDEHPDQAQQVLDAERAGQSRSTLVSQLEQRVGNASTSRTDEASSAEGGGVGQPDSDEGVQPDSDVEGETVDLKNNEGDLVSTIGGAPESVRQAAGTLGDRPDLFAEPGDEEEESEEERDRRR